METTALIIGIFILAFCFLSYEDEEKMVKSRLEDIWILLADKDLRSSGVILGLLRISAKSVNQFLDIMYGRGLFTTKAFFTSLSLCIGFGTLVAWSLVNSLQSQSDLIILIMIALFFLSPLVKIESISLSLIIIAIILACFKINFMSAFGSLFISTILDFFFILATRLTLRRVALEANLFKALFVIVRNIGLSFMGIVVPLIAVELGANDILQGYFLDKFSFSEFAIQSLVFNSFAIASSLLMFAYIFLALGYRLLWLLLPRAVYSIIKLKIFENKKTFAGIGIFLVSLSYPPIKAGWEELIFKLAG